MAAVENRDQFHGADESRDETTTINRLHTRARRPVSTSCDHAESREIGKRCATSHELSPNRANPRVADDTAKWFATRYPTVRN